eukprot:gene8707-biopygen10674
MVNCASIGRSRRKLRWMSVAVLTCKSLVKAGYPSVRSSGPTKGVGSYRQQDGGHGSRHPIMIANVQWRSLKAEVEKVSVSTAVGHGSIGPKARCNCSPQSRKGMKRQRSDDPGDRVHRPRMTPSSLFEGLVGAWNASGRDSVYYPGKLHSLRAVGCLVVAPGKPRGDFFLLHRCVRRFRVFRAAPCVFLFLPHAVPTTWNCYEQGQTN